MWVLGEKGGEGVALHYLRLKAPYERLRVPARNSVQQ